VKKILEALADLLDDLLPAPQPRPQPVRVKTKPRR
jgi:hypothetical protein